jgi:hypothetical protein
MDTEKTAAVVEKVKCCFTDCENEATSYPAYDEDGENYACETCIDKYDMQEEPLPKEESEDDDGSCGTCGGSGGGDYPGIYCPSCSGSGMRRLSRYADYDPPERDDYWDAW